MWVLFLKSRTKEIQDVFTNFHTFVPSQASNPFYSQKNSTHQCECYFLRRGRDSNPRNGIAVYSISNAAPSTSSATSPSDLNIIPS